MSAEIIITRDWDEVRQAMAVVHDTFCEAGYLDPRPSGLRMIPAYLNPGTTLLLGVVDGRPAAATALIPDGPFGLPSDRAFVEEIDGVRGGPPLFEVGSLGVLPWARRHTRDLITTAFAATLRVLRETGRDTRLICSVEPRAVRFYSGNFDVQPMCDQERPLYGAPAALVGGTVRGIENALRSPGPAQRRVVRALADDPDPAWLIDRRSAAAWPAEELGKLLVEAGAAQRLAAQLELAGPALQAALGAESGRFTRRRDSVSRRARRRGSGAASGRILALAPPPPPEPIPGDRPPAPTVAASADDGAQRAPAPQDAAEAIVA